MNNERPNLIINLPAMLILLLLIYIGSAFGHGGEKHDSAETTETTENVLTVDLSSELASTHDSIFATIQSGFENLSPVFKEGCYNCHTTSTEYPWYYKLPFIRSMIDDDISEAKKHMDMSQGFPFGGHGKPADDLVAIREDVVDSKMPGLPP